jgi:hypothetical protein
MKMGKSGFDLEKAGVAIGLLGFLLLVGGIACIYWPAGLITAGVLLLAWSALAARATAVAAFEARRNNKEA